MTRTGDIWLVRATYDSYMIYEMLIIWLNWKNKTTTSHWRHMNVMASQITSNSTVFYGFHKKYQSYTFWSFVGGTNSEKSFHVMTSLWRTARRQSTQYMFYKLSIYITRYWTQYERKSSTLLALCEGNPSVKEFPCHDVIVNGRPDSDSTQFLKLSIYHRSNRTDIEHNTKWRKS